MGFVAPDLPVALTAVTVAPPQRRCNMTKNRLPDLNDHLFAQIERLSDEGLTADQIDTEVKRGGAIVAAADQILRHAALQVQAAKIVSDHGNDPAPLLPSFARPVAALIEGKKQ